MDIEDRILVCVLFVCVVGIVVLCVLLGLVILAETGVIWSVDYDQAVQQFKDIAGTEDIVVISHEHLTDDVDFSLVVDGIPAKGNCQQHFNKYLVCTLDYAIEIRLSEE